MSSDSPERDLAAWETDLAERERKAVEGTVDHALLATLAQERDALAGARDNAADAREDAARLRRQRAADRDQAAVKRDRRSRAVHNDGDPGFRTGSCRLGTLTGLPVTEPTPSTTSATPERTAIVLGRTGSALPPTGTRGLRTADGSRTLTDAVLTTLVVVSAMALMTTVSWTSSRYR